jgi:hypothetical protein
MDEVGYFGLQLYRAGDKYRKHEEVKRVYNKVRFIG